MLDTLYPSSGGTGDVVATLRRHTQSTIRTSATSLELPWWRSSIEDEDEVSCIYCGTPTDDHYDPGLWNVPFTEFEAAHIAQIDEPDYLGLLPTDPHAILRGDIDERKTCLHICSTCGWWVAEDRAVLPAVRWQYWVVALTSMAALQELELSDISAPMQEVRRYLVRKFEARATMHPRLFELTVASVFRDSGYRAVATAYSNDGGIDVVLDDGSGKRIGVQVKRSKRVVEVEQIRAFLGALTLGGYARGVFVSASTFSKGALDAAAHSTAHHTAIALVNANRFLDMLRCAQLSDVPGPEDCGIGGSAPLRFHRHSHYHLNSL